ncbi:uncharacterized protein METZ01_LOCUS225249 [marine metagenome]|uniref:Uncharacterized protein n=1 Tax=marine metagenome TaxID=408172 RepID=A0A382GC71_9ZZZZ
MKNITQIIFQMARCIYILKSLAAYKNEYQSTKEIRDSQELSPINQAPFSPLRSLTGVPRLC